MKGQGLSKGRRLHLKNDFQQIIQGGKRIQGCGLVLWYKPFPGSDENNRRLGIVISRKLGNAVVRNRIKRLLREAFRLNWEDLQSGVDYIFNPRCSDELSTLCQMQHAMQTLCQRAGLWQPGNASVKAHTKNEKNFMGK